jgi:cytochrome P450
MVTRTEGIDQRENGSNLPGAGQDDGWPVTAPAEEPRLLDLMFDQDAYDRLREQPVSKARHFDGSPAWLVTRFADAMALLADPRVSSNPAHQVRVKTTTAPGIPAEYLRLLGRSMALMDAPQHTWMRSLVARSFTARRVQQLRGRIGELAGSLLDELAPRGEVDLLADFAYPLPFAVISDLLGMPPEFRGPWREAVEGMMWGPWEQLADCARAMAGYATRLVEVRRAAPGDDLLSALTHGGGDDRLDDDDLAAVVISIINAGHETTAQLITNGMLALLTHPDQLSLLREDPELLPGAVEEMLRYWGPAELATPRFTTEPVQIGDVTIPAGETIQIIWGAVNKDESKFTDAGQFNVARRDNTHLAFGHGMHYCLGAALARAEGEVVFGILLRRFPDLALAVPADQVQWKRGHPRGINRLVSLPVRFGRQRAELPAIPAGHPRRGPDQDLQLRLQMIAGEHVAGQPGVALQHYQAAHGDVS